MKYINKRHKIKIFINQSKYYITIKQIYEKSAY